MVVTYLLLTVPGLEEKSFKCATVFKVLLWSMELTMLWKQLSLL